MFIGILEMEIIQIIIILNILLQDEGFYDVTLYSLSIEGCKDTLTREEYIKFVYPVVDFEINDTEICVGENVFFSDFSEGIGFRI